MNWLRLQLIFCLLSASRLTAALIVSYNMDGPGIGVVQPGFAGVVTADNYDPRTAAIGQDGASNTISGFSTQNDNVYMRSSGTGTSSLPGSGTNAYHTFGLSVTGLGVNEVLNLTDVDFTYEGTGSWGGGTMFLSFYSDAVGFDDFNDRLQNASITGGGSTAVNVDLTSANSVAGNAFTGLTNGSDLEFRIYFGDTLDNTGSIQRVKRFLEINGEIQVIPEPGSLILLLFGFAGLYLLRRWN